MASPKASFFFIICECYQRSFIFFFVRIVLQLCCKVYLDSSFIIPDIFDIILLAVSSMYWMFPVFWSSCVFNRFLGFWRFWASLITGDSGVAVAGGIFAVY